MLFEELHTLSDIQSLVTRRVADAMLPRLSLMDGVADTGELPLAVAEPGPLMAHAVILAGPSGITRQRLRSVFDHLDERRFERGLEEMMMRGDIIRARLRRRNRAGNLQQQIVFLPARDSAGVPGPG